MNKDLKSKCCQADIEESTGHDGLTRQYCSKCKWNILIAMEDRHPEQPSQEDWEEELSEKIARMCQYFKYVEAYDCYENKRNMMKGKYDIKDFVESLISAQEAKTKAECAEIVRQKKLEQIKHENFGVLGIYEQLEQKILDLNK